MTKEELKLHIDNRYSVCSKRAQGLSYGSFYDGYMDCYSELEEKLANADYQLEGRDNEIAELKKACDETQKLLDKQIEATYKLDKENAELKEKNKWYSEQVCNKECAEVWGNLTKAKELLKQWLQTSKASGCDNINIVAEAEKFISEVEK